MQRQYNPTHVAIRNLLFEMNYPNIPNGICLGVLFAAIRDFLVNKNLNVFNKLSNKITNEKYINQFVSTILKYRAQKKENNSIVLSSIFNEQHELLAQNIKAFTDTIALFSLSNEYTDVFGKKISHDYPELIFKNTFSEDIENNHDLFSKKWSGVYTKLDFKLLFFSIINSINYLENKNIQLEPFVITFQGSARGKLHIIGFCYDPLLKIWHLIDAEQLPIISIKSNLTTESLNKMIEFIFNGFLSETYCILKSSILCLANHYDKINQMILLMEKSAQFIMINKISLEKSIYTDSVGYSWLHYAAINKELNIIQALLSFDNIDKQIDTDGLTPLMLAINDGDEIFIENIISLGANVNFKLSNGITPIFIAAQNGSYHIVELLLKKGAEINIEFTTTIAKLKEFGKINKVSQQITIFIQYKFSSKQLTDDATITLLPYEIAAIMGRHDICHLLSESNVDVKEDSKRRKITPYT